jgi:tRNA nucleotidyltransferase (CCA-adding enzyme)
MGERAKAFVVGGAVRDRLLGRDGADLDLVVLGDPAEFAAALGAEPLASHDRFGTGKFSLDGRVIDVARARTETYPAPGALPVVAPAASIGQDLARRDFTINAIAEPYGEPGGVVDPHGGAADLERGLIRVLHPRSFVDDPTRAIRAARYAARLGFELEPETERLLREADLGTVSADRREAELLRLAAEPSAPRGFELLRDWGLVELREGGVELAAAVAELLETEAWRGTVAPELAVLAAATGAVGPEAEFAAARPQRPSEGVELARGGSPLQLLLARALGAEWLDRYMEDWRRVELEIGGEDLIAAGVEPGPALGRGLAAALRAKLDGELSGREAELAAALAAARD